MSFPFISSHEIQKSLMQIYVDMKTTYSILEHICSGALPWLARKVLLKRKEYFQNPLLQSHKLHIHILKNVVNRLHPCLKTFRTLGQD